MRFIETKRLRDYVLSTGSLLEEDLSQGLSARLSALPSIAMQEVSLEGDRAFLQEISSVLNVIASIIYHPHLTNKREEVILRIELAQQLSREDFWDTARDSKLWKEHGARMIPEEVYYHQHIDELRIYENRFIGFLVDRIDRELARYSSFYLLRLPTLSARNASLDRSEVGDLIERVDRLRRKTQFIKSTFFYREVSRGKPISPKIQPTNILLKDRLYRFCFRFYLKLARYEDRSVAQSDLCTYYTILLLRELDRAGFALTSAKKDAVTFEREDFTLTLTRRETALSLTVAPHGLAVAPAQHWLGFRTEGDTLPDDVPALPAYDTVELLSLWERSCADSGAWRVLENAEEADMIRAWLEEKIFTTTAHASVYKKYCPVCGRRTVEHTEAGIHTCSSCYSSYFFAEDTKETTVWFRNIRKKGIS